MKRYDVLAFVPDLIKIIYFVKSYYLHTSEEKVDEW